MNVVPALNSNDIFAIPLDHGMTKQPGLFLLHAPLADTLTLADYEQVIALESFFSCSRAGTVLPQWADVAAHFIPQQPIAQQARATVHDLRVLYVLPSHKCNFSCPYCYSAKGRSSVTLSWEKLHVTLDWFLAQGRLAPGDIRITFMGGGEPLMAWGLIKKCVAYAKEKALLAGHSLRLSIVTNGSFATRQMLTFFAQHTITPSVSFELIEKIQDSQRGHFARVAKNLRAFCDAHLSPVVRSVITERNVSLLTEMVHVLAKEYPGVTQFKCDPVTDPTLSASPERLEAFHTEYHHNFFEARKLARSYGITLTNAFLRRMEYIAPSFCPEKLCLTPQGTFTMCPCLSSPIEEDYANKVYGHIRDDLTLYFDEEAFRQIQDSHAVERTVCAQCFAKYSCGGGCTAHYAACHRKQQDCVCELTRAFTRTFLLETLMESQRERMAESVCL